MYRYRMMRRRMGVGKMDSTCARGGSEIVKGDGRSATEGLLATVKVVRFSVFLAGAAE